MYLILMLIPTFNQGTGLNNAPSSNLNVSLTDKDW